MVLVSLVVVAACSQKPEKAAAPAPAGDTAGAGPGTALGPLAGTSWRLVRFQSMDGTILAPDDRSKYTLTFGSDGRVSLKADCNQGSGTWASPEANALRFGPIASTLALCAAPSMGDRYLRDFQHMRSYILRDGMLHISLMADGGIYDFEPLGTGTRTVSYSCTGTEPGTDELVAAFAETDPPTAVLERGGTRVTAYLARSASGARYEGANVVFWDKGGNAQVTWFGVELRCGRQD